MKRILVPCLLLAGLTPSVGAAEEPAPAEKKSGLSDAIRARLIEDAKKVKLEVIPMRGEDVNKLLKMRARRHLRILLPVLPAQKIVHLSNLQRSTLREGFLKSNL